MTGLSDSDPESRQPVEVCVEVISTEGYELVFEGLPSGVYPFLTEDMVNEDGDEAVADCVRQTRHLSSDVPLVLMITADGETRRVEHPGST
ncbi:hypothetical protein ACIQOW_08340 [Kitasatospora sp. NPDC091335]|uniref:hypothetical protein n=1 Tax=Kitasatospora sp. NPDC091335 TaxID=3364085 RepID=UPI0038056A43